MIEQFSISKSKKPGTLASSSSVAPSLTPIPNTSITDVINIDVSPGGIGVDGNMQQSGARSDRLESQSRSGQPSVIQTLSDRDRFDRCDESGDNEDEVHLIDIDSFLPFPDIETDRIVDDLEASQDSTFNLLFRSSEVCDQPRQFTTQRHFLSCTEPSCSSSQFPSRLCAGGISAYPSVPTL